MSLVNLLSPKISGKLVLHSRPDFEDGALALLEELLERGYRPIVLCEGPPRLNSPGLAPLEGTAERSRQMHLKAVHKNTVRGRYHFLTAATVITTHALYGRHRRPASQRVINIWHGESLVKSVGRLDGASPPDVTCITAMSNVGRAFRCAEFGLPPSRVLITGAPRNDRLLRADRAEIRSKVLRNPSDTLLIWMPTFRVGVETGRVEGSPFAGVVPLTRDELDRLDDWLEANRFFLLTKPHPTLLREPQPRYRRIQAIDTDWIEQRDLTTYTLLKGADGLLTDASTVWVDFLLTGQPILYYFPDLDSYRSVRPINLEPYEEWVPGPVIGNVERLLDELQAIADGDDRYREARIAATRRFHRYADASSSRRVLDAVGLTGEGDRGHGAVMP